MKRTFLIPCYVGVLASALWLSAQDAPPTTPAPTAPPTPGTGTGGGERQRGERGDRGDRGDRGNNFQRGGGGNFGGGGGFSMFGLDEKQRELYREASEKNRDELTKLDEKLRSAQQELIKAVLAENYDDKLVRDKADAVAKIQSDMTVLRAKALSSVAPTLKPEQREQLETSRFGAAMLTSGGLGGFGGGPGGGGFGGGTEQGRGFRGQGGPGGQTGFEQGPNDRGNRTPGGGGGRRGGPPPTQ